MPSVEVVSSIVKSYQNSTLLFFNKAVCEGLQVKVENQSMRRELKSTLPLSPHSFVNGFRWHIRAYSESHKEYRDFLLSYPGLSPIQKQVIEDDDGMEEGSRVHTIRAALA